MVPFLRAIFKTLKHYAEEASSFFAKRKRNRDLESERVGREGARQRAYAPKTSFQDRLRCWAESVLISPALIQQAPPEVCAPPAFLTRMHTELSGP